MGWYNVAILWDGSNIGDKESSTSKECIQDTRNIVDVYDIQTDGRT